MLSYAQIFFSSWSWRQKVELCRLYGNREFDGKGRVLWWLLNYYDSCVCLCCMLIIISPAFFRSSESQYSENLINFVTRRKICATNLYGNLLGFSLTSDFIDCSFPHVQIWRWNLSSACHVMKSNFLFYFYTLSHPRHLHVITNFPSSSSSFSTFSSKLMLWSNAFIVFNFFFA